MQFVTNGPNIPESLLQQHEDGQVVFFCGAGISSPAKLPDFKGLVEGIYSHLGTEFYEFEQQAFNNFQYDLTLSLLEQRYPGRRMAVRNALAQVLKPKRLRMGATDTHASLLNLARAKDGATRLVTTNFDRLFEREIKKEKRGISSYVAPMLPVPKSSRWNGIAYLHGLLPKEPDDASLSRLVLTSGDFGLAYLTERWASRFASDLFRNYVVCFVGYGINDPVMRYMMDALAADRLQGEKVLDAYAFGAYETGKESVKRDEWRAKGVVPILYESSKHHIALHSTLKAWAETWRNGTLGRERIVVDYAIANPSESTVQDNFVGRMLWALEHKSGLPAKRFAEFNPAPSLDWLTALSERRYVQNDLSRFDVFSGEVINRELQFSMVRRPAPYSHAPWMSLGVTSPNESEWDKVMMHLAEWLARHLNDPKLVHWLIDNGGRPGTRFASCLEFELDKISKLEREGKAEELKEISLNSPNGLPSPHMRTIWRLFLSDQVKINSRFFNLYSWKDRVKRDGLTVPLRFELRTLLSPKVRFRKPFSFGEPQEETNTGERLKQLVDWEVVLAADNVLHFLKGDRDSFWKEHVPALMVDIQHLLFDALDLQRELGEADNFTDRSVWDMQSIKPHRQNRGFRDWVALIELLRDAWTATNEIDPERASIVAAAWFHQGYPLFKRLALFAASQNAIPARTWVRWLKADNGRWLWVVETRRETMRLLVEQRDSIEESDRLLLEKTILEGPHSSVFRAEASDESRQHASDHWTWFLLTKLGGPERRLGTDALSHLNALSTNYPSLREGEDQREEFSMWMTGSGDPDYQANHIVDVVPRRRDEIVAWLRQSGEERKPYVNDTWRDNCRRHFCHSLAALIDLSLENVWPIFRWAEALQAWSEDRYLKLSLTYLTKVLLTIPDAKMLEIAYAVSWWLQSASKIASMENADFLGLCKRILALQLDVPTGRTRNGQPVTDPVGDAINHPVGHVVQALINLWFHDSPNDNDGLPPEIETFFTQICNSEVLHFRHGRVLLASRLIALFRVDESWTSKHLSPLFDWELHPLEAREMWEGFLWSPRLYWPLLNSIKKSFLETAKQYDQLGDHSSQYSTFLTYAALGQSKEFTAVNFQQAVASLPSSGLQEVAHALNQALNGAGDQRGNYWRESIYPFIHDIWPKFNTLATENISAAFASLAIAAGDEFPQAMTAIAGWLQPVEYPDSILTELLESALLEIFPMESLRLMGLIIDGQRWMGDELPRCLDRLQLAMPQIVNEPQYKRLLELVRK